MRSEFNVVLLVAFIGVGTMFLSQPTPLINDHLISASNNIKQNGILGNNLDKEAKIFSSETKNLDPNVVKLGLIAYDNAIKKGLTQQEVLTIVDYSKPSTEPRLWVLNLKTHQVMFNELVAHGRESGGNYAVSFSNQPSSNKSSLGTYLTTNTYDGKHGYSLKLEGLDKGLNDKAASRAVVVHSAEYVSADVAKANGRLGRSEGCLALNPAVTKPVIDTIKNGTVVFAYYPSSDLLDHSSYLKI